MNEEEAAFVIVFHMKMFLMSRRERELCFKMDKVVEDLYTNIMNSRLRD